MESLKEKAKALLQQCEVVTLTSINKEGYPTKFISSLPYLSNTFPTFVP